MTFVGLENFTAILFSAELLKILLNTALFVAIMLALIGTPGGLPAAL